MTLARLSPPPDSVIVVGAGPAGATAARTLAAAGARVTLLDRARFPRNKPCGGGISLRVLRRFPYLERELPAIRHHTVNRLHLEGPDGAATTIDAGRPAALMIRRCEFDALLVSLANRAGASIVCGADIVQASEHDDRVTLTARDGREFCAALVVAADGVHSVVARRLGFNRGWAPSAIALDMMEETPTAQLRDRDPSRLWVRYGDHGYAYVFPKRDYVNVGIGYVLGHFREAIKTAPHELQRRFVDMLRERGIVDGESAREYFTPFLLPVGGTLRTVGRGRVLVAGDAGGFVNAVTAEGIYYAMVSGDLAATAILCSSDDVRDAAARYRRACEREIGRELRDAVVIQRYLFRDPRRIGRLIGAVAAATSITKIVCNFVAGDLSYNDMRRRILSRSPMLACRTAWEYLLSRVSNIFTMRARL